MRRCLREKTRADERAHLSGRAGAPDAAVQLISEPVQDGGRRDAPRYRTILVDISELKELRGPAPAALRGGGAARLVARLRGHARGRGAPRGAGSRGPLHRRRGGGRRDGRARGGPLRRPGKAERPWPRASEQLTPAARLADAAGPGDRVGRAHAARGGRRIGAASGPLPTTAHADVLRAAGIRSLMVVPLVARGRRLGALTLAAAESDRRYGPSDLRLAPGSGEPRRAGAGQRAPLRRRASGRTASSASGRGEVLRHRLHLGGRDHLDRRGPAHHAVQRRRREDLRLLEGGGDRGAARHPDPRAFPGHPPPARGAVRGRGRRSRVAMGERGTADLRPAQERRGVSRRRGHLEARGRRQDDPHGGPSRRHRAEAKSRRSRGSSPRSGSALATTLDYEETLSKIAELAVRDLADFCIVDIVEDDGEVRRRKVVSRDPSKAGVCDALLRIPLEPGRPRLTRSASSRRSSRSLMRTRDARDGRVVRAERGAPAAASRASIPGRSSSVPLLAHGKLLGAFALVSSTPSRMYGPADVRSGGGARPPGGALDRERAALPRGGARHPGAGRRARHRRP